MQSLPRSQSAADWWKGWVEILKPFHPFLAVFSSSPKNTSKSHWPGEGGSEEKWGWGWMKVNVWFVGMGGGRMWRGVTRPTIGCCVILKVFLGEYNSPFKTRPVPRSFSLGPEVLHFVRRTAAQFCLSSPAFWLAWHAWEGHEHWLFRTWHAISWEDCLLREREDKVNKES